MNSGSTLYRYLLGVVWADSDGGGQLWGELINQGAQQFFVSADFVVEGQPALGNSAYRLA